MKNKLLAIAAALALAISGCSSAKDVIRQNPLRAPGEETGLGAETFDSSDYSSGSNYQSTVTEGPSGKTWTIYYGCFSTSSAITGTRSAAMRLYTSNNYGYLKTNFDTSYVSKVVFNAKASTANSALIKMNVEYSTDNSTWNYMKQTSSSGNDYHAITPGSSASSITAFMPTAVSGNQEHVYLKWSIDSSSTKPSKSNAQLTIDDINIYCVEQAPKTLSSIALSGTYPTSFYAGDAFSHEGMTVTATYNDESTKDVTSDATFSGYNMSNVGNQTVTVSYIENEVTKTATYDINVKEARTLSSIALSGTYPTSFYAGDAFSHEGMTVTATYNDESTKDVTSDATFSGYNMSNVGNQTVTVSYTEKGVTKTEIYGITIGYPKGSEQNPYSVSEALVELAKLKKGENNGQSVYVRGIVTAVGGALSSTARNPVTFTMADLNDNTKTVMAFSIQDGNTTDTSAENYIEAGYIVFIYGYLINFNNTLEVGYLNTDTSSSGFVSVTAPTFTLSYDANGGTGDLPSGGEYDKHTAITIPGNVGSLEKDGFAFNGWNTYADPTNINARHYDVGDTLDLVQDTTLYAEWLSNTPSITVQSTLEGYTGQHADLEFTYGNLDDTDGNIEIEEKVESPSDSKITIGEFDVDNGYGLVDIGFDHAGSTTISFKYLGNELATCSVTVNQSTVTITGLPSNGEVEIGKTLNLGTITVSSTGSYNNNVIWSSSRESVATVTSAGVVTGENIGTAVITVRSASDEDVYASCTVTVTNSPSKATWNLAIASYDEVTDENSVTWSSDYAIMNNVTGTGTKATNYLGGDAKNRTSSRMYSGNVLTITPVTGYTISSIEFTATTSDYATVLRGSTWINAKTSGSGTTVIVTPIKETNPFSANVGGTCGFTSVNVYYNKVEDSLATIPSLAYEYTKDGNDFEISATIRFRAIVSETLWNEFDGPSHDKIEGYGVLFSTASYLGNTKLKDAAVDGTNVKDIHPSKAVPTLYDADDYAELSEDSYIWNLRVNVPDTKEKLMTEYVAVAYIVTSDRGIIYLDEARASVKSLAQEMYNSGEYDENSYEGSLYYLANLELE